jgi:hypothetical protein
MFSKFCKFTSNVLKMVIYKNAVIPYFNILFKIVNTISYKFTSDVLLYDRLCGLVVRVLGYRSGGPGSIPGTTRKKK